MKRSVRLALKKETLSALTGDELGGVAAGSAASGTPSCFTCTCRSCLDCLIHVEPSLPDTSCVPEITFRTLCRT